MAFVTHTPLPNSDAMPSALDFNSLNALKRGVQAGQGGSAGAQREVARQFEAMFIQMVLKQARQTSAQMPSIFDTPASRMVQSLGDEQAALAMADPGIGLADALLEQMRASGGHGSESGVYGTIEPPSSRLPGLQSRIGESSRLVADTLNTLLGMPAYQKARERVSGAVQGAPAHIRSFVDRMAAAADLASARSGLPARLILGQAALESGWGQHEITRPDGSTSHNLFGIKAGGGWRGDVVHVMTTEYSEGVAQKSTQAFRAYGSYAESFMDYAELISTSRRYGKVISAPDSKTAAQRMQESGYATDPSYADKLISIMAYFNSR